MSKMPAKKKSCFQITSVTQAQVAGNSITDDTESLDDPDETRTDVSKDIFDVSRTHLCVCDRSSSEEAVNNVGEHQDGQASVNGVPSMKSIGTGGRNTPHNLAESLSVPAAMQTNVTATSHSLSVSSIGAPTSCSSRFRVIKLDHGTGEPFRRGRWTCTEFYEKDSDSNRTVDSAKPNMITDLSTDRDGGLGAFANSVASSCSAAQATENTDSRFSNYSLEPLLQGSSLSSQIGSVASAFQPTGYATSLQPHISVQPVVSQTFVSNSLNGVHQGAILQKSPLMPPTTQPQQLSYSNTGTSSGQPDFRPQHFGSSTQSFPATCISMVPSSNQGSLITPAGPKGFLTHGGEAALTPGLHLLAASASTMAPVGQTQPLGGLGITAASSTTITSQSVPATVPSAAAGWTAVTGSPVSSNVNSQSEDTKPKSDALPQPISSVAPGKDAVKPFITEGLSLSSPTVSFFGITIPVDGDDDSASGASVVAIDNKIEQAMDLVKNHLMYAVREEVEVLKEQIKELYERNSVLERENAVLKSLANSEQLNQLSTQLNQVNSVTSPQQQHTFSINNSKGLGHYEAVQSVPHQPNITSA